jgi:hypothetical protein
MLPLLVGPFGEANKRLSEFIYNFINAFELQELMTKVEECKQGSEDLNLPDEVRNAAKLEHDILTSILDASMSGSVSCSSDEELLIRD